MEGRVAGVMVERGKSKSAALILGANLIDQSTLTAVMGR